MLHRGLGISFYWLIFHCFSAEDSSSCAAASSDSGVFSSSDCLGVSSASPFDLSEKKKVKNEIISLGIKQ